MDFPVRNNQDQSRFECDVDGRLSYVEYEMTPGRITLMHTRVPAELGGRGIAGTLVAAALEHAREQHLQVVPVCSYAAAYIERHPEYRALVSNE